MDFRQNGLFIMAFYKKHITEMIEEVLQHFDLYSEDAVQLLLGTLAQESHFGTYLKQLSGGPAMGVFQMEPKTLHDIWYNYLAYQPELRQKICEYFTLKNIKQSNVFQNVERLFLLETNLHFQILFARLQYKRRPEKLPSKDDLHAMAEYWKKYYNTPSGKGTIKEFKQNYYKYIRS